jgi:sialate O-acetylesterase
MKKTFALTLLTLALAGLSSLRAEVRLNGIFTDHLVLQRNVAVPIWGTAAPAETVHVEFAHQRHTTQADAQGRWTARLEPMAANAQGADLIVRGLQTAITLHDVVIGEVWLAGGQSNMRFPLSSAHDATEVLPTATDSLLRVFNVTMQTAAEPLASVKGKWQPSTPTAARDFTAVGFFFARELREKLGVPIGIISASWGGTPIETWISLQGFRQPPALTVPLQAWDKAVAEHRRVQSEPKLASDYEADLARWRREVQPAFNAATKAYNEANDAGLKVGPKPVPAWPEPQNPDPMGMPSPSRRPQTPTISFNGMIAPLVPYALRGVIWYQGEANGGAGIEYRALFPRLIQDWRAQWGTAFPFLFVQLPMCYDDPLPVAEKGWPWLREAQFLTLREPRTSMAITLDVGNPANVHPANKRDVGHRLALLARRDVYGENLVATGPLYSGISLEGERIRVRFRETGSGLVIGQAPWRARGVDPLPTDQLIGFYVAGADRQWHAAEARVEGDSVLVTSKAVAVPVAVRYGWANSPRCNLYNREGLPAAPFRSDDWPMGAPKP